MAKRKDTEITGSETTATPESAAAPSPVKNELPAVESPSISPAVETAPEPAAVETPAIEPVAAAVPVTPARFVLRPRHKRYALLAASVTFAAALGAIVGALASGGFSASAKPDLAAIEESKAMQQSIVRLGKEVTTLKASLDAANKSAHTQIAKITDRLEHAQADITGSIFAPQTVNPTSAPTLEPAPLPTPRPRIAAAEAMPPGRTMIVPGWTIHDLRGGYVYVENHGEVYQVMLGAPLPGLGPVESVKRQDGRWVVTTPKGIIVSMRDRRYFEEY